MRKLPLRAATCRGQGTHRICVAAWSPCTVSDSNGSQVSGLQWEELGQHLPAGQGSCSISTGRGCCSATPSRAWASHVSPKTGLPGRKALHNPRVAVPQAGWWKGGGAGALGETWGCRGPGRGESTNQRQGQQKDGGGHGRQTRSMGEKPLFLSLRAAYQGRR